ncbi:DUF2970 domain-containing protein [uncultured Photobacterium sp.]|uniref:DUF2970 domain-containing protein n=1 Tax=uncultured Photobacterium sp. TaxID=173973 RepID=UPI0026038823|nr:DUF2970 domain-containing protein [uncultured Photobacterium sp.]
MAKPREGQPQNRNKGKKSSLALSVAAALFGVQSDHNRREDFNQQSPWPFILAGIIGIGAFVGLLLTIVITVTTTR